MGEEVEGLNSSDLGRISRVLIAVLDFTMGLAQPVVVRDCTLVILYWDGPYYRLQDRDVTPGR